MTARPDPFTELRMTALQSTRGANFWSRRPVTRMDLRVGAYEDISSADVPGFTDALYGALPGLDAHHCSIGEPGGFIIRLRRGTYAPHIIEHVALELQCMIGHDVSYGKTRGGDVEGEYTLIFEHRHEGVGLRAAGLALDIVQRAFAGTLDGVAQAVVELEAIARTADVPAVTPHVRCAITGGGNRNAVRDEILRRGVGNDGPIVDVAPAYVLQQGLPFGQADVGIVLDAELTDVPARYRDPERARQLVSVLADAVPRGGVMIVPAHEWSIQEYARDGGCLVSVFDRRGDASRRDTTLAQRVAAVAGGRIVVDDCGERTDQGPVREDAPVVAQLAGALAHLALTDRTPSVAPVHGS